MELLAPSLPSQSQRKVSTKTEDEPKEYRRKEKEPVADVIPAIHFESAEQIMRGAMRIDGWNITDAEFLIKSTRWNKNISFRSIVSPSSPLQIYQIHSCYNFLKNALEIVQKLEKLVAATKEIDSHIEDIRVNKIMDDVSRHLRSAMEELLFSANTFPDSTLFVAAAYQPPLPQDLMLECHISNKEIIVNCYCMHLLATKPARPPRCSVPPRVGEVLQCSRNGGNYWAEVVDVAQVRLPSDRITSIFAQSNAANQLCTELRDKLAILL